MEEILNWNLKINKGDNKTQIKKSFRVNSGIQKLKIEFSYSNEFVEKKEDIKQAFDLKETRILEDEFLKGYNKINNLITMSIYCKETYVGCAHRHDSKQNIVISEFESTPGFIKMPIEDGEWQIILSVHAAYSDNICVKVLVKEII
ncbi:hypothetical protein [Clostridium hydrogenum]|uniref:hypothetical protein n=1 Tax=Clostridium hydrogenum TaxID=2855764 RepID=UPI001F47BADC|nr:hypothetical protein [Clostridium hydrogenum]